MLASIKCAHGVKPLALCNARDRALVLFAKDAEEIGQAGNGPVALVRWLVSLAASHGATALTYQVSDLFDSFEKTLPHIYFLGTRKFSRHMLPRDHAAALGRWNTFLVKHGKPIVLSDFLDTFAALEPQLTDEIMSEARARGVQDQFMVPVFGPFTVNGVVTFAFPQTLGAERDVFFDDLETAASIFHMRMVRHFGSKAEDPHLSRRENEVLDWVAKGKTNAEIALILGIKSTSVGTYVRRIFEKMGVSDRVSAAVEGVKRGFVH